MSRIWKLFGFKKKISQILGVLPFRESLDFSLVDWNQLNQTGVVYTANQVNFTGTNQDYTVLNQSIRLEGEFEVSFVIGSIPSGNFGIIGGASSAQTIMVNSNTINVRTSSVPYVVFNHPPQINKVYKVVHSASSLTATLFEDGVLIDQLPLGLDGFITVAFLGRFGSVFNDCSLRYVNINNEHEYLFTEGVGTQVNDTIGINHATFTTLNIDPLLIPTWTTGVDTKFNLLESAETLGYNFYDEFNDTSPTKVDISSPISLPEGGTVSATFLYSGAVDTVDGEIIFDIVDVNNSNRIILGLFGAALRTRRANQGSTFNNNELNITTSGILPGSLIKVVIELNTFTFSDPPIVTVNDTINVGTGSGMGAGEGTLISTIGYDSDAVAPAHYNGYILNVFDGTNNRNTFNNWGGVKSGVFGSVPSTETAVGSGIDGHGFPILGWNMYDEFNGLDTGVSYATPDVISNGTIIEGSYYADPTQLSTSRLYNNSDSTTSGIVISMSAAQRIAFSWNNGTGRVNRSLTNAEGVYGYHTFKMEVIDLATNNVECYLDGVLLTATTGVVAMQAGKSIGSGAGATGNHYTGVIINIDETISGVTKSYNTFNNWNGGVKSGAFTSAQVYEQNPPNGIDLYGTPLLGYNQYDTFNGVDTQITLPAITAPIVVGNTIHLSILLGNITTTQNIYSFSQDGTERFIVGISAGNLITNSYLTTNTVAAMPIAASGYGVGSQLDIDITFNGFGVPATLIVNGVEYSAGSTAPNANVDPMLGAKNTGSNRFTGTVINLIDHTGTEINTFNNWINGIKSGDFGLDTISETIDNLSIDAYGMPIVTSKGYENTSVINPINTQTALINHNNYDYFDGLTNSIQIDTGSGIGTPTDLTGKLISGKLQVFITTKNQFVYSNTLGSLQRFGLFVSTAGALTASTYNGVYQSERVTPADAGYVSGDMVSFEIEFIDYATAPILYVNGVRGSVITSGAASASGNQIGIKAADDWYVGVIAELSIDGVLFTPFNNWNGGTKVGTFVKYVAPESSMLTTLEVDNYLISEANSGRVGGIIDLSNDQPRSAASDAAVLTLTANSVTVITA